MSTAPATLDDLAQPMALAEVLALGEQLARALVPLHAQGRVHGALRPSRVGWQPAGRRATLLPAEGAERSLQWAAPEQTGRLDLPVDARADLYALGLLLYRALTGVAPFAGDDALELIHAHIAGPVPAPAERNPQVPAALSALVSKLLAKSPEDRYQSAAGLADDLAQCAAGLAARGRIEPFEPGARERGAQLVFSSQLVGRGAEVAALLQAFDRCCAGRGAVVLVEGYAGIGKTALIQQLYRPIVRQRGHFIAGKFDQVVRGVPFGALIQAFQGLVRQLLGESEARLAGWRQRLRAALGANAGVLTEVIPEIEHIVGAQPAPPALGAAEAQNRFQRVLQQFVAALATAEHPLVIFLDDLQWADAATLALLEPLAAHPDSGHLMLLGAMRDQEAEAAPALLRTLDALAAAPAGLQRIALGPLGPAELAQMLAAALHGPAAEAAPLAALVHAKTGGNPFFAMQFVRGLAREGLLRFDPALLRWTWRLDRIEAAPLADNVVDLMTRAIRRLAPPAQYLLTLAACIGSRFDIATLATVSEQPPAAAAAELAQAQAEGLVVPTAGAGDGHYAFLHDRVQQSAYALIPPGRRAMVHLTVGRLLLARSTPAQREAGLFDIVHHLNQGRTLIADAAERLAVARLDLAAGRRAKTATAHEAALALFEAGLELLGPAGRRAEPALAFELALEASESQSLCGRLEDSLESSARLLDAAPTRLDRARVVRLRCVQLEALARYGDSLAAAREGLALFDLHLPEGEAAKAAALEQEIAAVERLRAGRPIAALADLPAMTDAGTRMVMAMLTDIWSAAYILGDPTLSRLISATMVRLSLQHGNVEESAYGYVTHAITVGALKADYRAADEYGHLALAVNRRFDDRRRRAKVFQQFHAHVNFWCRPLQSCVAYAREACAAGLDSGDFLYASYAAGTELWAALASTQDLAAFVREYTPSVAFIERLRNPAFADAARLQLAWARALQSPLPRLGFDDEAFDEADWLARHGEHPFFACVHAALREQQALLLGSAEEAWAAAGRAQALKDALPGTLWPVLHEFWYALAAARAAPQGSDRQARLALVRQAQALFESRAEHSAVNWKTQALLLAAEAARLEGRLVEALAAAGHAAEFAARHPLRPLDAMAHECLARVHEQAGHDALALMHRGAARDRYAAWGAQAKVAAIEAEHPALRREAPPAAAGGSGAAAQSAEGLDLGSVLKASLAIAGETEMDRLLARLLHIAIENAGAERGALVLEGDEGPRVHGYEAGAAAVCAEPLEGSGRVPLSLVNLVRRTGEALVLAEATREEPHAGDDYVQRRRPRSLACLPVRHQSRALGVLVLEHRHAAGVFTPQRLAPLQALATQAAISLENARLVGGLKQALAEVERLKDELEAENSYLRRDLIAHVSHDLRTPLVSLRGYLELLAARGDDLPAEQRRQHLAVALRQSERLGTLIDELFELARLDFKGVTLARERFALAELAADVVQKFALAAEGQGVRLVVQAAPGLPFVDADLGLVERLLENLIGNALKHTPAGGCITLAVHAEGTQLVTEVRDSGRGIAAADLPHVFDRFYRGSRGAGAGGAGLGLAIARRIVELHGGTIGVASTPGEGSCFRFALGAVSPS